MDNAWDKYFAEMVTKGKFHRNGMVLEPVNHKVVFSHEEPPGFQVDENGIVIKVDRHAQADNAGVKNGWKLILINGHAFTKDKFEKAEKGSEDYELWLKDEEIAGVEENIFNKQPKQLISVMGDTDHEFANYLGLLLVPAAQCFDAATLAKAQVPDDGKNATQQDIHNLETFVPVETMNISTRQNRTFVSCGTEEQKKTLGVNYPMSGMSPPRLKNNIASRTAAKRRRGRNHFLKLSKPQTKV